MISWDRAYARVSQTREWRTYFGGMNLPPGAFREIQYKRFISGVAAATTPGIYGAVSGPNLQTFPSGAVILGITAAAYQAQTATGEFAYAPSSTPGRRDLFGLDIQYTNDERITADGMTNAEALLGSGVDTIFPCKELLIPPSQGLLISVASLAPAPTLSVTVVFHCMVPRAVS